MDATPVTVAEKPSPQMIDKVVRVVIQGENSAISHSGRLSGYRLIEGHSFMFFFHGADVPSGYLEFDKPQSITIEVYDD